MSAQIGVRWAVLMAGLLLGVYFYLNADKLNTAGTRWSDMVNGSPALTLQVMLDDELLVEKRIKSSDFFDAHGQRQVSFVRLAAADMERLRARPAGVKVILDGQRLLLLAGPPDSPYVIAQSDEQKIYLLAADALAPMMAAVWNERVRGQTLIQCGTPALCNTLNISSQDWGPINGPYLDTEIQGHHRSMPKGRWLMGPRATIQLRSDRVQKVAVLVHLLRLMPAEQVSFQGDSVVHVKVGTANTPLLEGGGRRFYPKDYLVYLDLQPGDNALVISFSKWSPPVREGFSPIAAYLAGIKVMGLEQ